MKAAILCCFLAAVISFSAEARHLHYGKCTLKADMMELWEQFSDIKDFIPQGDMSISLLRRNALNAIQPEESCCFLRQMLGFYLRNIFSHYTSSISMVRRRISSLANGLVSMEKTLSECHRQHICHCKDETRLAIKSFHDSYKQLDNDEAIQKAVSELDILLSWIEMPHH